MQLPAPEARSPSVLSLVLDRILEPQAAGARFRVVDAGEMRAAETLDLSVPEQRKAQSVEPLLIDGIHVRLDGFAQCVKDHVQVCRDWRRRQQVDSLAGPLLTTISLDDMSAPPLTGDNALPS